MPAPPVNSALNFPVEFIDTFYLHLNGGTLTGPLILNANPTANLGAATKQYVDAVQTALSALTARVSTAETNITNLQNRMTSAEANIATNASDIAVMKSQISQIQSDLANAISNISALSATVSNLNAQVIGLNNQVESQSLMLADHEQRISTLEGEQVTPTDPYIGAVVHLRDKTGHCQPAVVYEDWKALNNPDIVSVVVVAPYRLAISEWDSKIEVQKENGSVGTPFNYWHWPERYYNQQVIPNIT